jgi:P27 family predicted phage terminase small subunit
MAKADDERVRRNLPAVIDIGVHDVDVDEDVVEAEVLPDPPGGMTSALEADWHAFWRTPMARAVQVSDLPALHRLYQLRLRHQVAQDDCDTAPLILGSQGQEVANPRCAQAAQYSKEILGLEDRFGLNPQSRLRLIGSDNENAITGAKRRQAEGTEEKPKRADPRIAQQGAAATD